MQHVLNGFGPSDLHIHTKYSDGKKTVKDILTEAQKLKLRCISICDHNTLGAYIELKEHPEIEDLFKGKIIPGIEFDFKHDGKVFHMLGYNFDIDKLNSSKYIDRRTPEEHLQEQEENLKKLINACKEYKIDIDTSELKKLEGNDQANDILKEYISTHKKETEIPWNREFGQDSWKNVFGKNSTESFFHGYVTNPDTKFYIDITKGLPTAAEIAYDIHEAGGKVFLAHPFRYKSIDNHMQFLEDIYNLGKLDGIECMHTNHTKQQTTELIKFCIKHNLLISGGSDFHTEERQKIADIKGVKLNIFLCQIVNNLAKKNKSNNDRE